MGDGKPFVSALVTLDPEGVDNWRSERGLPALAAGDAVSDPEILAAVQEAVDHANLLVSKAESIRSFAILPVEWTVEGGQLTPSLKLKRSVVMKEFAGEVEKIYA